MACKRVRGLISAGGDTNKILIIKSLKVCVSSMPPKGSVEEQEGEEEEQEEEGEGEEEEEEEEDINNLTY